MPKSPRVPVRVSAPVPAAPAPLVSPPGHATCDAGVQFPAPPFESCRIGNVGACLRESSEFLGGRGEVRRTLTRFARALEESGIPYIVMGGLALNAHGYERVTTDIDVVVTADARRRIHELLDGRGFLPPFEGSRNLRDTTNGVRIDLVLAGDFPGDGLPKSVSFPDPSSFEPFVHDGVRYVTLVQLIELKLASGITRRVRYRDLGDVAALIHAVHLPRDFGERLDPFVRAKWYEMWDDVEADDRKDTF